MPAERPIFGMPEVRPVRSHDHGGNGGTPALGGNGETPVHRLDRPSPVVNISTSNGTKMREIPPFVTRLGESVIPLGEGRFKAGGVVFDQKDPGHRASIRMMGDTTLSR